jgi:hypothetical protein
LRAHKAQQRMQASVLKVAAAVSASTGTAFFVQLATNMAEALGAQVGCVMRLLPAQPGQPPRAISLATVIDGVELPATANTLAGTPSMLLLTQRQYVVADHVLQHTPALVPGRQDRSPGLCGPAAVQVPTGEVVGIFVLFRQALTDPDFVTSTLQIFASRASAEIERQRPMPASATRRRCWTRRRTPSWCATWSTASSTGTRAPSGLYGWSQLQVLGQPDRDPAVRRPHAVSPRHPATLEHGEWTGELVQRHRDGRAIDVEGRWTLVRGEDGQPQSILAINTDIPSARPPSARSSAWRFTTR